MKLDVKIRWGAHAARVLVWATCPNLRAAICLGGGGEKLVGRGFRRAAENGTPAACAPRAGGLRPTPTSECGLNPRGGRSRRREEKPSAATAQQGAKVPVRCPERGRAAGGVAQASSPASSGGVSPPVPTRGETPRELAGGTPAVPCATVRWQADRALGGGLRLLTSAATGGAAKSR